MSRAHDIEVDAFIIDLLKGIKSIGALLMVPLPSMGGRPASRGAKSGALPYSFDPSGDPSILGGIPGAAAPRRNRTSLMFSIADKVGALHNSLALFRRYKLNMTRIETA